jgi:hypothetical protein
MCCVRCVALKRERERGQQQVWRANNQRRCFVENRFMERQYTFLLFIIPASAAPRRSYVQVVKVPSSGTQDDHSVMLGLHHCVMFVAFGSSVCFVRVDWCSSCYCCCLFLWKGQTTPQQQKQPTSHSLESILSSRCQHHSSSKAAASHHAKCVLRRRPMMYVCYAPTNRRTSSAQGVTSHQPIILPIFE